MIIKAYNTYFNTANKDEMHELRNRIYDELVDQYLDCNILITEEALESHVDEVIEDMTNNTEYWEEYA